MDFGDVVLQKPNNKSASSQKNEAKCFSIMTGVVKENFNEKYPGKVLVELYYGEKGRTTTEWLRVMQPYCGKEFGDYFMPEVNTEVVVGFNLGDINKPVVLGCLWNEMDKPPKDMMNKENSIKSIKTKGGHEIIFDETKDKEKIQINTKGKLSISLEDGEKKITVKDEKGDNVILIDSTEGVIRLKAKKKLVLNAGGSDMITLDGGKASMKADSIELNASQTLTIKGQNVKLEGNMAVLKAGSSLKAESGGILEVKGAMVKIN